VDSYGGGCDLATFDPNPVYRAAKSYVDGRVFYESPPRAGEYVQSRRRTTRFDILEGHVRLRAVRGFRSDLKLGPVERDVLYFMESDAHPCLCVLIGGMGSGKTSTVQHVLSSCLESQVDLPHPQIAGRRIPARIVVAVDFDATMQTFDVMHTVEPAPADHSHEYHSQSIENQLLNCIDAELSEHLTPDEEFAEVWSWALGSDTNVRTNPATGSFEWARTQLRAELGDGWRDETAKAIDTRRRVYKEKWPALPSEEMSLASESVSS